MEQEVKDKIEAFKKHIGKVIKRNRMKCGLKQQNLANILGVTEASVSRYEKGRTDIKASTMAHISHVCDFDLIEYVLDDGLSLSRKFYEMTRMGNIPPYLSQPETDTVQRFSPGQFRDMNIMEYMSDGRILFTARVDDTVSQKKQSTNDILFATPDPVPLPFCNDDHEAFERHMLEKDRRDRLRILLYGYELLRLFQETDTPYQTTSSISRQILRRLIKAPSGEIDNGVYDYYWKCAYYEQ